MNRYFRAVALAFAAAAAFHAFRAIAPVAHDGSSSARHALFVLVNALVAVGLWVRPRWLFVPFALLTAQQLWSHGGAALAAWRDHGRVDVTSLAIVLLMPATLTLLLLERRRQASGPHLHRR
ncbi:MAG: hypothetical protein KC776_14800 [Myxococcales bacterium]|nr:hypothetical protein [Myxococcales bacterium]MCB9579835.1 hypothetical protein [Polyangiaceae bacterium]